MNTPKRLFALLILLWPLFAQAQITQTIRGVVLDAQTEMPLPGASVVIVGSNPQKGTIADANGQFRFERIPIGRYVLAAQFLGYAPTTLRNLDLVSGKEMVLEIKLTEQVIQTKEVVVTATRNKAQSTNEMALISARSFTVEETERYAGSLGDPSRMVANYAGVMSVSDERNDIVIRGNSPIGVLWRLDEIDIPNPNHFGALGTTGGPVSILNNNLLKNSDFYTGAFPAEYGNGLSGAFDLKMRTGNNEKYEFVGQVGFNGFEFGAEGPFRPKKSSSFLVNYRYSTLAALSQMGFNVAGGAAPQYQDVSFKVNFPTKKGAFSVFGIGGISYIELLAEKQENLSYGVSGTNTYFGSNMGVSGAKYVHYLSDNTRLILTLAASTAQSSTSIDSLVVGANNQIVSQYDYYESVQQEDKLATTIKLKHKFNKRNHLNAGVVYEYYKISYQDSVNLWDRASYLKLTNANGDLPMARAFAGWKHLFNDQLNLYAGLHGLYFHFTNNFVIEPRAALQWKIRPKHSINLGFGMHSQTQPKMVYFKELEYPEYSGKYLRTNTNLGLTQSTHYVAGYDFLINTNFRLKLESYFQQLSKVPVSDEYPYFSMLNAGDFFAIPAVDSLENKGTGTNYGVELTLEKFLSKNYYFLITGSLFESKYTGADGVERNTAFNGNFVLNMLAGYEIRLGQNSALNLNGRSVWAGGKRYIPIDLAASVANDEEVLNETLAYQNRHDDYLRFDLRIGIKTNGKHLSQEWAVDLQNLTNSQNIFRQTFDAATGTIKNEYQTGFYPMFLYRIRF